MMNVIMGPADYGYSLSAVDWSLSILSGVAYYTKTTGPRKHLAPGF